MHYLLDTNAVIALLDNSNTHFAQQARKHKPGDIGISSIVAHELFYGAFKSQRKKQNLKLVNDLQFAVVEFDKEDALFAGQIRALLAEQGTPIGPYDVLIAGQAVARNLVLVTHNIKEFARVADLHIEDWQR